MLSALWQELRAAIQRLNDQSVRIAQLERAFTALEQEIASARGN